MTRRSYSQFCAVAKALDLVGERWTLLLVRELLLGPRRFTDLQTALPGLGTSLLATRLRQLEDIGVARRDRLPAPAASTVYQLTESGMGLAPAVKALADWGTRWLDRPEPGETVRPQWLALHRAASARPDREVRETYQVHVGEDVLHIRVEDGRAVARTGSAPYPADLVLTTDPETFLDIAQGITDLAAAVSAGRAEVQGHSGTILNRAGRVLSPAHTGRST